MSDAARIQQLEDRVAVLEEALGIKYHAPPEWGLTPMQDQIVGMLRAARALPYERMMAAIYGMVDNPPLTDVIRVQSCRIRPKLKAHGIEIRTLWPRTSGDGGYWIPAEQKHLLDA